MITFLRIVAWMESCHMYPLEVDSFTQHISLEMHPLCFECQQVTPSLPIGILQCGYTTVGFTIPSLKEVWVASRFRLLQVKLLWTFVHKLLHEIKAFFLWDKRNGWALGKPIFSFERNWFYFEDRAKGSPDRLDVGLRGKKESGMVWNGLVHLVLEPSEGPVSVSYTSVSKHNPNYGETRKPVRLDKPQASLEKALGVTQGKLSIWKLLWLFASIKGAREEFHYLLGCRKPQENVPPILTRSQVICKTNSLNPSESWGRHRQPRELNSKEWHDPPRKYGPDGFALGRAYCGGEFAPPPPAKFFPGGRLEAEQKREREEAALVA